MMWDKVIILGLILTTLSGAWLGFNGWKSDMQSAANEKAAIELKLETEIDTRKAVEAALSEQKKANVTLVQSKRSLNEQINSYLSIFERHDLTALSRAKPGLIELRINKATKKLFEELENETN